MHSAWFRSTFLRILKFLQIKEGGPNFCREPILLKVWTFWSPLLYFNFKTFMDPHSLSFIRFQCILDESAVLFWESSKFLEIKEGGPNLWWEPILQTVSFFWSPLLCFNFISFMGNIFRHSFDFNAFCMIREYFSQSLEISTN